jgi:Ca2+-binding RTX toxin-like protein
MASEKFNDLTEQWQYVGDIDVDNVYDYPYKEEGSPSLIAEGKNKNDKITAGPRSDTLFGADGDDILKGLGGDDVLKGGAGSDVLDGGDNSDDLQGFEPGKSSPEEKDILIGGAGADRFRLGDRDNVFYQGEGYAVIDDWDGTSDSIVLPGSSSDKKFSGKEYTLKEVSQEGDPNKADTGIFYGEDLIAVTKDVTLTNFDRFKFIETPEGPVNITGTADSEPLLGGTKDDVLAGQGGDDELIGNLGNDKLDGGSGRDILIGSVGSDPKNPGNNTDRDALRGGLGEDIFVLGDEKGVFYLGDGYAEIIDFSVDGKQGIDKFRISPIGGGYDLYEVRKGVSAENTPQAEIYYTGEGLNDLIAVVTNTDQITPGPFGNFTLA